MIMTYNILNYNNYAFKKVCKDNDNTIIIINNKNELKDVVQRLYSLGVPIYERTFLGSEYDRFNHLFITNDCICGLSTKYDLCKNSKKAIMCYYRNKLGKTDLRNVIDANDAILLFTKPYSIYGEMIRIKK